ncbi:GTP cyclohydrolase I [Marinitenerispora sediminis]|uniref:GTP cyclohydrolase 1 n=1 Tax=Marinitenerispora sediminis TaxID=1931232 RepID=A0A368T2Y1_9ACTN|nr:GTP cyclohydrolase I [Marinitenerispora sediminis]RCV51918.1 GTP cyclohydrolase I FolE [Marinitenerispora sediminis]RCV52695.1 GTP cyclohydrolase I FolE [Marinitenerispora sediminis]RCV55748.1 GTP cyclohydrolase I FolE [Marinitenerispora sediminis]
MIDLDKVETAVTDLLLALGVDEGEHTQDTPRRVAKAWAETLSGYDDDPSRHLLRTFSAPHDPGLIIVTGIRLSSTCAHHLLPVTGTATVAYRPRPGDQIVGLSKLARVLHGYARRLQVQERIGHQVVTAVQDALAPVGSACVITAEHGCMAVRGVNEPATVTTTRALSGEWRPDHPDVRAVLAEHSGNLH